MGQMQRRKRLKRELASDAPLKVFWRIPLRQRLILGMTMAKAHTEMMELQRKAVSYFREACSGGENQVTIKQIGRNTTICTATSEDQIRQIFSGAAVDGIVSRID